MERVVQWKLKPIHSYYREPIQFHVMQANYGRKIPNEV